MLAATMSVNSSYLLGWSSVISQDIVVPIRVAMGKGELSSKKQILVNRISNVFVSLFIIVSRKKAITQVIGFLMLENAIALLAVAGTYGVPLLVEFGVFLDALMGFLVMQIFVYHIHETFDTIDVEQLTRLKH